MVDWALWNLTERQKRFAIEMARSGNATRAALKVYRCKNPKSASVVGHKVMKNSKVKAVVKALQTESRRRREIEAEEVITHLADCATRSGKSFFDARGILVLNHKVIGGNVRGETVHDLPDEITNAIDGVKQRVKRYTLDDGTEVEEVETELRLVPKINAIDLAMKHKGLFAPSELRVGPVLDWDSLVVPRKEADDRLSLLENGDGG